MATTRDHIIESALEVFRENGYDRTTVRMIAERAGVPLSTLYTHIDGKEQLFLSLVEPVLEHARVEMAAILAMDLPAEEKLRKAIVRATTAFDAHHPELVIYLRDFFPVLERSDPESRRAYEAQWMELVKQGIEEGVVRDDLDPKMLVYGILGMINWLHQWYRPNGRYDATEVGEIFAELIINGLAVRPQR